MEVQTIDYAPPVPFHRQQRVHRFLGVALFVAALAAVAVRCGPGAWGRVRVLYWQGRAMRYVAPAGQTQCGPVEAWLRFGELAAPPGPRQQPVLFLHELVNGRGESRLVAVEGGRPNPAVQTGIHPVHLWTTVFRPGGLLSPPGELSSAGAVIDVNGPAPQIHWTFGQRDADDGSHFTVSYDADGKRQIVDGWLHDNDTVTLEPRK